MRAVYKRLALAALLATMLAGCSFSPEDGRARGGGPGAMSANVPAEGIAPESKVVWEQQP